jgi:hypothetical protein
MRRARRGFGWRQVWSREGQINFQRGPQYRQIYKSEAANGDRGGECELRRYVTGAPPSNSGIPMSCRLFTATITALFHMRFVKLVLDSLEAHDVFVHISRRELTLTASINAAADKATAF